MDTRGVHSNSNKSRDSTDVSYLDAFPHEGRPLGPWVWDRLLNAQAEYEGKPIETWTLGKLEEWEHSTKGGNTRLGAGGRRKGGNIQLDTRC